MSKMALVAYSDESDLSDVEEDVKSVKCLQTQIINTCPNNSYKIVENRDDEPDIDSDNLEMANPIFKNKLSEPVSQLRMTVSEGSELDWPQESDVVNDVPTLKTWNITKKLNTNCDETHQNVNLGKTKHSKLRFVLPALSEFDDDDIADLQDESSLKKKLKPSSEGTGLFSVLPKPRSSTSLVPHQVSNRTGATTRRHIDVKPKRPLVSIEKAKPDSDDEAPVSESTDFFSLSEIHALPSYTLKISDQVSSNIVALAPTPLSIDEDSITATLGPETFSSSSIQLDLYGPIKKPDKINNFNSAEIDEEALRRLVGKRNIGDGEVPNIIDINADDALMPRDQWVTRALCDEKPKRSFSKKKEGNPTQQQKRKHQITYLAHQAQEREQDLQNSWGQNRFTKMQTQSKYGF